MSHAAKRLIAVGAISGAACLYAFTHHTRNEVVFIGDSLTSSLKLPSTYTNRGVPGQSIRHIATRFPLQTYSASTVFLLAGTNDVTGHKSVWFIAKELEFLHWYGSISGAKMVVCTIPPMSGSKAVYNPRIQQLNAILRNYASEHHLQVADYYSALEEQGRLAANFDNGDGVHINDSGHNRMLAVVAPLIH